MSAQGIFLQGVMAAPAASMAGARATAVRGLGSTAFIARPGVLRAIPGSSGILTPSKARRSSTVLAQASNVKVPKVVYKESSTSAQVDAAPKPVVGEAAKAAGTGAVFGLLIAVGVKMFGDSKAQAKALASTVAPAKEEPLAEPLAEEDFSAFDKTTTELAELDINELRRVLPRMTIDKVLDTVMVLPLDKKKAVVPSLRGDQVIVACKAMTTEDLKVVMGDMDGLEVTTVLEVLEVDALKAVLPSLTYRNRAVAAAIPNLAPPVLSAVTPLLPTATVVIACKEGLVNLSNLNVMAPLMSDETLNAVAQNSPPDVLNALRACVGAEKVASLLPQPEEAAPKVVVKKAGVGSKTAPAQESIEGQLEATSKLSPKELAKETNNTLRYVLPRVSDDRLMSVMPALSVEQKKAVVPSLRGDQLCAVCKSLPTEELLAVITEIDSLEVTTVLEVLDTEQLKSVLPSLSYRSTAVAAAVPKMPEQTIKAIAPMLPASTVVAILKSNELGHDRTATMLKLLKDETLAAAAADSPAAVKASMREILGDAVMDMLLPADAPKKPFVEVKLKSGALASEKNKTAEANPVAEVDPFTFSDAELCRATPMVLRQVLPRSTAERTVEVVKGLSTAMKKAVVPSLRGDQLKAVISSMNINDLKGVVPNLDGLEVTTTLAEMTPEQIKVVLPLLEFRNRAVANAIPRMSAATVKKIVPDLPAATIITALKEDILSDEMIALIAPLVPEETLTKVLAVLPPDTIAALETTMGKEAVNALMPQEAVDWTPLTVIKAKSPEQLTREAADKAAKEAAEAAKAVDPSAMSDAQLAEAGDKALRTVLSRASDDRLMAVMALLTEQQKKAVVPSLRADQLCMVCKTLPAKELRAVMNEMDGLQVTTVLKVLDAEALKAVVPSLMFRNRAVAAALPAMDPAMVKVVTPMLPAATIVTAAMQNLITPEMVGIMAELMDDETLESVLGQLPAEIASEVTASVGVKRMGKLTAATGGASSYGGNKVDVKERAAAAAKLADARAAAAAAEAGVVANPDALSDKEVSELPLNALRRVAPRLPSARLSSVLSMLSVERKAAVVPSLRGEQVVEAVRTMRGEELAACFKEMDGLEVTAALQVLDKYQLETVLPLLRFRNQAVAVALGKVPVATLREITPLLPPATIAIAFTEELVDAAAMTAMCPEIPNDKLSYIAERMSGERQEALLAAVGPARMTELIGEDAMSRMKVLN